MDFSPIPTFGGTFEGRGHTISGLSLTGSGNVRGLFRYIQPSGAVRDLHVSGAITPSDRKNTLGGLVGENQGTLTNCSFSGTVSGAGSIGGLVGINEAQEAGGLALDAADQFADAIEDLGTAARNGRDAVDHLKAALSHLRNVLGKPELTAEAIQAVTDAAAQLIDALSAMSDAFGQAVTIWAEAGRHGRRGDRRSGIRAG